MAILSIGTPPEADAEATRRLLGETILEDTRRHHGLSRRQVLDGLAAEEDDGLDAIEALMACGLLNERDRRLYPAELRPTRPEQTVDAHAPGSGPLDHDLRT